MSEKKYAHAVMSIVFIAICVCVFVATVIVRRASDKQDAREEDGHATAVHSCPVTACPSATPTVVTCHDDFPSPAQSTKYSLYDGGYECYRLREINCIEGFQPQCSLSIKKKKWDDICVMEALMWFDINNTEQGWNDLRACGIACRGKEK